MTTILLSFFVVAVLVGYYFDYKQNKENYKEKGQGKLYLFVIGAILLIILKKIFF
jgi:uncharacterized membrane protein